MFKLSLAYNFLAKIIANSFPKIGPKRLDANVDYMLLNVQIMYILHGDVLNNIFHRWGTFFFTLFFGFGRKIASETCKILIGKNQYGRR